MRINYNGNTFPEKILDVSLPRTFKPFWRTMCTKWFKHCTLKVGLCISMIMHQYTQKNLWQNGLMNMKVKLNISYGLHSHRFKYFCATLRDFGGASQKTFSSTSTLHSDLSTVLEEEWLKIPLATVKDLLYLSFPRRIYLNSDSNNLYIYIYIYIYIYTYIFMYVCVCVRVLVYMI